MKACPVLRFVVQAVARSARGAFEDWCTDNAPALFPWAQVVSDELHDCKTDPVYWFDTWDAPPGYDEQWQRVEAVAVNGASPGDWWALMQRLETWALEACLRHETRSPWVCDDCSARVAPGDHHGGYDDYLCGDCYGARRGAG